MTIKLKWSDFAYKSPNSHIKIFDADKTSETLGKIQKKTGFSFSLEKDL